MHIDEERVTAIGRLAIAGGELEWTAFLHTRFLMGGQFAVVRAVAQKLGFSQLMDLNSKLVAQDDSIDQAQKDEWKRWATQAREAMAGRNEVLHSWWNVNADSGELIALNRSQMRYDSMSASDINARAAAAQTAAARGVSLAMIPQEGTAPPGRKYNRYSSVRVTPSNEK